MDNDVLARSTAACRSSGKAPGICTRRRTAAVAALRRGLDLGMTHIDTAEMYGDGAPSRYGEAHRRTPRRGVPGLQGAAAQRLAGGTIAACEQSLVRLETDRLDCYLLHWRGGQPLAETIAAFEALQPRARSYPGASAISTSPISAEQAIARRRAHLACNQVLYHLQERAIEHAVIPWCESTGVAVVAYSPFGHDGFPGPGRAGGPCARRDRRAHGATPRQRRAARS